MLRDGLPRAYRVTVDELHRIGRDKEAMALIEQAVRRDKVDAEVFE